MIIILLIIGALVLLGVGLFNALIRLRNQVKNSWSQIDVQLKRRADLIPNLVSTVKGYAKHEKELLESVTKARSAVISANTVEKKANASNQLSSTLKSLFAVAENYPQLKANENFLQLQEELSGTENKISYARQHYNDMVLVYNTKIQQFPANLFASMLKFSAEQFFKTPEAERKNVKVSF